MIGRSQYICKLCSHHHINLSIFIPPKRTPYSLAVTPSTALSLLKGCSLLLSREVGALGTGCQVPVFQEADPEVQRLLRDRLWEPWGICTFSKRLREGWVPFNTFTSQGSEWFNWGRLTKPRWV